MCKMTTKCSLPLPGPDAVPHQLLLFKVAGNEYAILNYVGRGGGGEEGGSQGGERGDLD